MLAVVIIAISKMYQMLQYHLLSVFQMSFFHETLIKGRCKLCFIKFSLRNGISLMLFLLLFVYVFRFCTSFLPSFINQLYSMRDTDNKIIASCFTGNEKNLSFSTSRNDGMDWFWTIFLTSCKKFWYQESMVWYNWNFVCTQLEMHNAWCEDRR